MSELPPHIVSKGIVFPKDGKFITGKVRGALREGKYEAKETYAALRTVRAGDRVIELGAGIGYMSSLVAKHREIEHVTAFEANPHLIPYIRHVHEVNRIENATVVHGILGKRKGKAQFYTRDRLTDSSLDPEQPGIISTEEVDVLNADHVFRDVKPTVLIADIEGAEVDLIPQLDLSYLRAAIIETHPQWIGPEGMNTVMRAFMDAGLAYYARASHGKVLAFRRSW